MGAIASILLSKGLPILAGALLNGLVKRSDFFKKVKEKLGLSKRAEEDEVADALKNMSYEQLRALAEYEREIQVETEVTKRLEIDSNADSWFTSHIRPLALTFVTLFWLGYMLVVTFWIPTEKFVMAETFGNQLLNLLMAIYMFYFGGRTWEKNIGRSRTNRPPKDGDWDFEE